VKCKSWSEIKLVQQIILLLLNISEKESVADPTRLVFDTHLYYTIIFVDGQTSASSLISLFPQQSTAAALSSTVTGLYEQYLPGKNSNGSHKQYLLPVRTVTGFENSEQYGSPSTVSPV
jgi:hypothetical protein